MFGSSTEGWAVSRSLLLHTADGGETWTPASKLPGNFYYFGPGSVTATHYFQMQPPTYAASVWRTADGGKTWNTLPATLPQNDYKAVFFLNNSLGWAAGDKSSFALTQDGGETWTVNQLPGDLDLVQIQFVTPGKGWLRPVYATEGGLLVSIDGGRTWNPCHTGLAGRTETLDMRFLDENTGFLLARTGQNQVRLLRTLDGGGTWTAVAELPVEMTALCFTSAGEGWLAGPKGRILRLQLN